MVRCGPIESPVSVGSLGSYLSRSKCSRCHLESSGYDVHHREQDQTRSQRILTVGLVAGVKKMGPLMMWKAQ